MTSNRSTSKTRLGPSERNPNYMEGNNKSETALLQEAIANLQLPHMPQGIEHPKKYQPNAALATIRILVVADLDLTSSSALAEYTLQQKRYEVFDASLIDLCIACGPFCRDEDLRPYQRGRQQHLCNKSSPRRRKTPPQQEQNPQSSSVPRRGQQRGTGAPISSSASLSENSAKSPPDWTQTPFFRTPEETAALEGLMTASLSQLESIVCRVVYCPGSSDPLTILSNDGERSKTQQTGRLTPNSRNIHQQWLSLAPGLGCGGLFFLDGIDELVCSPTGGKASKRSSKTSNTLDVSSFDRDDMSDGSDEGGENDKGEVLSQQISKLRQSHGYFPTLTRLLKLAPSTRRQQPYNALSPPAVAWKSNQCQSILVTHYVDSLILTDVNVRNSKAVSTASKGLKQQNGQLRRSTDNQAKSTTQATTTTTTTITPMPWPIGILTRPDSKLYEKQRQLFLENSRDLLCLEIATGSSKAHPARWIPAPLTNGKTDILLPGSLRERGEFCLVDMGLVESVGSAKSISSEPLYEWKVLNINFHHLNEFPDE